MVHSIQMDVDVDEPNYQISDSLNKMFKEKLMISIKPHKQPAMI